MSLERMAEVVPEEDALSSWVVLEAWRAEWSWEERTDSCLRREESEVWSFWRTWSLRGRQERSITDERGEEDGQEEVGQRG
jgi:hypothetical protein